MTSLFRSLMYVAVLVGIGALSCSKSQNTTEQPPKPTAPQAAPPHPEVQQPEPDPEGTKPNKEPPSSLPAEVTSPAGFPAKGSPAIVELIEPGNAPLVDLRYRVEQGYKSAPILTMAFSASGKIGDNESPKVEMPAIQMGFDTTVVNVSKERGELTYEFEIREPKVMKSKSVPDDIRTQLIESLKSFKGIKGSATLTARGAMKTMRIDDTHVSDPQALQIIDSMKSSFEQLSNPFPDAPVGVGARWKVKRRLDMGTFTLFQTTTITLKKITPAELQVAIAIEATAPRQAMKLPEGMPTGPTAELQTLSSKGTGEAVLKFDFPIPKKASLAMQQSTHSVLRIEENQAEMAMQTDMKLNISRK